MDASWIRESLGFISGRLVKVAGSTSLRIRVFFKEMERIHGGERFHCQTSERFHCRL